MMATALASGLLAGLVWFALQSVWVTPLIHHAELYESHAAATGARAPEPRERPAQAHAPWRWAPAGGFRRAGLSLGADFLAAVGFALLLVAGMTLRGAPPTVAGGLLWGLAGYAAFMLAPALGLPPELPGTAVAPLGERQLWWVATVVATAAGLGLLAFAPRWLKAAGLVLLAVPHAVGAPVAPLDLPGLQPPLLVAHYVAAVLVTGAAFWVVLGVACAGLLRWLLPDGLR